jgi:hypothetical protein
MSKPDFVDNQKGNLLVSALKQHLQWRFSNERSVNLDIATGYVNPDAFSLMADELEQLGQFRLLIGADPLPPSRQPKRKLGENDEKYERRLVNESLEALSKGLQHDRDLMGFHLETSERLERMLTLLKTDKVEVKRFPGRFMHGKAYIFSDKESYLIGSSNFTAAGLTSNLELNVGRYDPQPVEEVADWFEDLWGRSEDFKAELIAIYEQRLEMHRPYLVFLRILWELYGKELEEDSDEGGIALTSFQSDGLRRAERIIEKYNGVIIADGVGLGKTFLAGGLIEKTLVKERKRVLLIGPAALVRGPWQRFMDNQMQGLQFEAVSFQQLSYLDDDNNFIHLRARPEEYDLIVIDEAQAYRNPATTWAESLRRLLRGHPPKKVMMLSATPVNNSLWDLYHMLMYFIGNDAAFAELGIRSLRDRFKVAQDSDPFTLNPDYLFEILDATTVRRTRRFIKKYYGGSTITIKDDKGKELQVPITFPKPHVRRVDYPFTTPIQTLLDRFIEIVVGDEETDPELTMARYTWGRYALEEPDEDDNVGQQMAMTGLLRTSLLKRLESSVYALAETCNRMRSSFEGFLAALELGSIPKADVLGQWIDADGLDDDEFSKILDGNEDTTPADGFDVDELRRDVQHDLKLIIELRDLARKVNHDDDPKLHQLLEELRTVIKESEVEGGSPEQKRNRRKVLLFSYYEDTLRWVKEFLEAELGQDDVLKIFDGRLVSVAGSGDGHGVSREAAVFGFAPISSEAPASHSEDQFDVMLTTDVLAEGQNLQQCRHIINYDLPWNPMRLVQRHGRIDRINSKHKDVWMRCFFPAEELELLLRLEERIQHKVAQAAASIGVENAPIPGGQEGGQVFDSHHNEIGKLLDEDATIFEEGGTDGHAYSGEEFRRELVKGVESYSLERVLSLAWGSGCGLPTEEERGFVFCAKVGDEDRPDSIQLRFVPESLDTSEVSQRRLDCLRRISCTTDPDGFVDEELKSKVFDAWNIAQNDIHEEWTMATDPRNISPEVRPLFRKMGQWLLDNSPDGVDHDRLIAAKNAIEAPWDRRRENHFRKLFKPDDCATPIERRALSRTLVENIEDLGLEAYPAPKPLIPIASEEVHLLAWVMLV